MKKNRNSTKQNWPIKVWFHRKKKVQRGTFVARDEYAIKAQKAWFRARSVYKLLEIQERFDLIRADFSVIDIKEVKPFSYPNVKTIQCSIFDYDILSQKVIELNWEDQFDLITSDIAPNTTWRFDVDQYASVELNIAICEFSDRFLKKWWNMLLKVFKWEDFNDLVKEVKKRFRSMKTYKPLACRDSSHEEYIICFEKI